MKRFLSILIVIFALQVNISHAQQWEVGATGVATGYMGDLNRTNPFYFKNLGGGLQVKYNFNPTWGVRSNLNYGLISADANDFHQPGIENSKLAFNTSILEWSAVGEFNFFKFVPGRNKIAYTPYLFAGIGVISYNPYIHLKDSTGVRRKINLREQFLEYDEQNNPNSYGRYAIVIPFGIGFKYNLNGPFSIGAELGYRVALTDHLDNVSQNYTTVDFNSTSNEGVPTGIKDRIPNYKGDLSVSDWQYLADPTGNLSQNKGTARGDGRKYDGYMTVGITLSYTFISQKCYWW